MRKDCGRLKTIHLARFILDVVALVVSFGLIEHGIVAHDEVGIQLIQNCLSEVIDCSESESAEPDVCLNHVAPVEPDVAFDSDPLLFAIVQVAIIDVDPTGLHPPPST